MKKIFMIIIVSILLISTVLASRSNFNDNALYPKFNLYSVFGNENCCLNCRIVDGVTGETGTVNLGETKYVTCSGKRAFVDIYSVDSNGGWNPLIEVSAPTTIGPSDYTKYAYECYYCNIQGNDIPLGENGLLLDGNACSDAIPCPSESYYCDEAGYCIYKCTKDSECGVNEKCENSECIYHAPTPPIIECKEDIDCVGDDICLNSMCQLPPEVPTGAQGFLSYLGSYWILIGLLASGVFVLYWLWRK